MNRTCTHLLPLLLAGALVPGAAFATEATGEPAPAPAPDRAAPDGMSVDYLLGLMEAGMQEGLIVDLVRSRNLRFDLRPGDLDRLLAAGAGEALIGVVVRNGRPIDAPSRSRPRRLENSATAGETGPADGTTEEEAGGEPPEERWYGGVYTYIGAPYGYGYWAYPYPYPYYSYYYAYPYGYGYPYYYGYGHHHRSAPPRGYGGAPRSGGWHSSPPRGTVGGPRGGSSGSRPPASRPPRGSH